MIDTILLWVVVTGIVIVLCMLFVSNQKYKKRAKNTTARQRAFRRDKIVAGMVIRKGKADGACAIQIDRMFLGSTKIIDHLRSLGYCVEIRGSQLYVSWGNSGGLKNSER